LGRYVVNGIFVFAPSTPPTDTLADWQTQQQLLLLLMSWRLLQELRRSP